MPGHAALPEPDSPRATVGLLMMRSYVLSADTARYDAVIRALEARGLRVLPAFAGGLDGRPAIESFFRDDQGAKIDALLSLTGFSLVGGAAYNDTDAAVETLGDLDVPYVAAHPLEFQTLGQCANSAQGLGPIETTMLIALPELDGATNPSVFAGRHGQDTCTGCARACRSASDVKAMAPCPGRIEKLAARVDRLAALRRSRAQPVQAKSKNYKVRLAGCVANRSKDTDEVDRYCSKVGFHRIAHMPDVDAIRRSRLKKKTLFEMDDDIIACRKEYIRLAETLWNGTEGLAPAPMEDRDIFELLGFD